MEGLSSDQKDAFDAVISKKKYYIKYINNHIKLIFKKNIYYLGSNGFACFCYLMAFFVVTFNITLFFFELIINSWFFKFINQP